MGGHGIDDLRALVCWPAGGAAEAVSNWYLEYLARMAGWAQMGANGVTGRLTISRARIVGPAFVPLKFVDRISMER
jgi:hypothetical protein